MNSCLCLSFSPSLVLIPPSSFEKQQRDRSVAAASLLSAQLKFIILSNTLTLMVLWWAGLCSSSLSYPHKSDTDVRCWCIITSQHIHTQRLCAHNILHTLSSYIIDAHMRHRCINTCTLILRKHRYMEHRSENDRRDSGLSQRFTMFSYFLVNSDGIHFYHLCKAMQAQTPKRAKFN